MKSMKTEKSSIKVLIVDDHKLFREGVAGLLKQEIGIEVIGQAENGEEAIALVKIHKPNVVLMDIQMPGMGGIEATRKLLRFDADIKILALTVYGTDLFPKHLLEEGAAGYVTKDSGIGEVINAIRAVHAGNRYISPDIAQKLALKRFSGSEASPFDGLSEREIQVMIMITSGKKAKEISDILHLSPKTINTYRYRLFEKLNVQSDVELTHMALRYGLIESN